MSESRAFLLGEVERVQQGGDRGVAPSEEEQAYGAGAPGAGDDLDDGQDEEQEPAAQPVDLPDEWPISFWDALTDEAKREYEDGSIDLAEEWAQWSAGLVDTSEGDAELPAEPLADLPPTADQLAEWSQRWTEVAQQGGNADATAAEALAHADSFAYAARATALAEYRAGRRRDLDLHPDD